MKLLDFINSGKRIILDGAMGSRLLLSDNHRAELYNIIAPDKVAKIHRSYLESGSNLIYTNTFGANPFNFPSDMLKNVVGKGIEIALKEAKKHDAFVAYDCGPLGVLMEPFSEFTFEQAYEKYADIAKLVAGSGVDCVVLETLTDTQEMRAGLLAFKENTDLPVVCSMSFDAYGRTVGGSSVEIFAMIAQGLGADAVGINCSLGAKEILPLIKRLANVSSVPLFCKPNAGLPVYKDGKTGYNTDASEFAFYMREIAALGVNAVGGCCGTDDLYIKLTAEVAKNLPVKKFANRIDAVCSSVKIAEFSCCKIIGERLNPTGKPALKQAILTDDFDYIKGLCLEQISDGADILDVNAGMAGIDEAAKLYGIIKAIQGVCSVPVQIDSVKPEAIERALRAYNGIAIINSVNAEAESLQKILPLAKKYGAYIVGLCLDNSGVPATAAGRIKCAQTIISAAEKYGMKPHRILIDPLTLAVAVDGKNPSVTLETLRGLKALKIKTIAGLSNVSYGLPCREKLNAAFYTMLKENGIDSVIVNPVLSPGTDPAALKALSGQDNGCKEYIEKNTDTAKEFSEPERGYSVEEIILSGLKNRALPAVKSVADSKNYNHVLSEVIIPALNKLGSEYESGRAFLPQLLSGSECASVMIDYLKNAFMKDAADEGETMLIATVFGDVHDIGKNIVKAVLSNYGYRMIDLGKNVSVETILQAVEKYKPDYLGLSALMTTTLDNMRSTVYAVKQKHPHIVVCVGGAVVTEEFAAEIGADIYGKDAQDTVKKLRNLEV